MVVPFGSVVHVSAPAGEELVGWLAERAPRSRWVVTPIATGLEDVFISLTQHAADNYQ
jgi:ABC-2 type transport system ATP-binding protein